MKNPKRVKWIIILATSLIICLIHAKCSKAESAASDATDAPWFEIGGVQVTTIPFIPPELPDPTPLPNDYTDLSLQHSYKLAFKALDAQDTTMYYKVYSYRKVGGNFLFNHISTTGGTSVSNQMIWIPNRTNEIIDLEELGEDDYRHLSDILYQNQYSFQNINSACVGWISNGGYCFTFSDSPNVELDRDYKLIYTFDTSKVNLAFSAPYVDFYKTLGIDDTYLDNLECICTYTLNTNQGQIEDTFAPFTWAQLRAGLNFEVPLNNLVEGQYVTRLDISIVVDPHISTSNILQVLNQYYNEQQTPYSERLYGSYYLTGTAIRMSRLANVTEDKHKMNWFEKLIFPDPDWTAAYLSDFVGTLSQNNAASWVFGFRALIYNWLTGSFPDATLTIPNLYILGHSFFDGSTFNLTAFLKQTQFRVLYNSMRTITSILITTAFINSLYGAVTGFFNLRLWSGVNGEDLGDES